MASIALRSGCNISACAIIAPLVRNTPISVTGDVVVIPSTKALANHGIGFACVADVTVSPASPGFSLPALTDAGAPVVCDIGLALSRHGDIVFDIDTAISAAPVVVSTPTTPAGQPYDTYYDFIQNTANSIWLIPHGLGKFPNVTVLDSTGEQVIGDVFFPDMNTVRVQFSSAFAGFAHLS